jgi:serine/threonine protein kinase
MSFDPLHDPTIPSQAPRYYQGRKLFGGRYTLMKRLGSGGMGVVWLAQDNELGIQRALKFAPPEVAADARSVAMLKREAIAGTSLAHPHIVRIFDFAQDTQAGETAVVMEVVEGKSLADLQAERIEATGNGYFEPEEIEPWLQQAAAALDYAHGEGRAHRDLKPQNFMIETATGRLKIMDFGISRRIGDSHATLTGKDSSGTLPYMSPQQVQGEAPSSSDDIYGLGATLYDLLTGSPPFIGGDIPSQVREKPPTPLNQRRTEVNAEVGNPIPAAWEQGVLACLSKQREDRPSSAGAAHQFISQMQAKQEAAAESGPHSPLRGSPQAKPPAKPTPSTRSPHDAAGTPPTHPPHQPLRGLSGPLWGAAALVMISLGVWALLSKPKEIIKEVPKLVEDTASKQEAAQQRQRADELEKKHQEEEQKRLAAEAEAKKAREDAAKAALPPPVVPRAVPVGTPATATKSIPFENSLGMKFVPVLTYKGGESACSSASGRRAARTTPPL